MERGAERFLAGRQFLVITIVFLIAQLTSFHDVLTFPLTDVTIPPLLSMLFPTFPWIWNGRRADCVIVCTASSRLGRTGTFPEWNPSMS